MPSKYMSDRLARVPFREPPSSQASLHHEFLADIDAARANTINSLAEERLAWKNLAHHALARVVCKEAKAYVWLEFAKAQHPLDEPMLFMAGYRWLVEHAEHAPKRNPPFLFWKNDATYQLSSLLAAACHLPEPPALDYLQTWLSHHRSLAPPSLPVHRIRASLDGDQYGFYDESALGYKNLVVWEHIMPRLLPHIALAPHDFSQTPYLPFAFEFSFVDHLLPKLPTHARTWLLSNALFAGDIAVEKVNVVEHTNTMKGLSRLARGLNDSGAKAFAVWDMVQRQSHDDSAARLLQEHVPDLHAMLNGMGLLECDSILSALHNRWSQSEPVASLPLPEGAVPTDQWTSAP